MPAVKTTGALAGNAPIGPSRPLRQVYPVLPGVKPPFIPTNRNTRDGRGMIVPVTAAADTPVLVTHNLGRIPQSIEAISNDGGTAQNPAMTLAAGVAPTRTQATIQGNQTMTNCLVRFE